MLPRTVQSRRLLQGALDRAVGRKWRLPLGQGRVALTFDDGPDPLYTPLVLDELRALEVRATFFCVGERVASAPDVVRRMQDEGHAVGSHGYHHDDLPTLPLRKLIEDFRRGHHVLEDQLGARSALYRPAHGDRAPRTALTARAHGLTLWMWTVDPEDYLPDARPDDLVTRCANLTDGDVIVLHDGLEQPESHAARDRSATVAALRPIVEHARARGLEFVRLPA